MKQPGADVSWLLRDGRNIFMMFPKRKFELSYRDTYIRERFKLEADAAAPWRRSRIKRPVDLNDSCGKRALNIEIR